jgi:hypothetical protein
MVREQNDEKVQDSRWKDVFLTHRKTVLAQRRKEQPVLVLLCGFAPLRDPIRTERILWRNRIAIDQIQFTGFHQDLLTAKENRSRAKTQRRKEQPVLVVLCGFAPLRDPIRAE